MARVICIDDYETYAEMVATMLEKKGHKVRAEIVPISIPDILKFKPDVIVLTIVRKLETISAGGLQDFYTDVEGAKALLEVSESDELKDFPIVITSIAVLESEMPKGAIRYKAFLEVPQKLEALDKAVRKLAEAKKRDEQVAPE